MVSALVALPIAAAVVFAYFLVRLWIMRPRAVAAANPTPDLRDEPPAVVNLLVNRLAGAPQVASATLLDLAARRVVELHQVADDPEHTLVSRGRAAPPPGGPGYERRVLERLDRVGDGRATPVAQLVQRYADGGVVWQRRLARDAVLDARRRGLIRRSDSGGCLLAFVAAGLAAAALLAPLHLSVPLLLVWVVLSLVGGLFLSAVRVREAPGQPDVYTAKGRQATAHWLGVAAWLRAHEPLRDLPPAAVAVWDRYLAYGVALGAMPHAVRILDFETVGSRDLLSSKRVHYPPRRSVLHPLGPAAAGASLVWSGLTLPLWIGLGALAATTVAPPYLRYVLVALFAVQTARCLFRLVRSGIDRARPVTVTGTVLDVTVAGRQHTADEAEQAGFDLPDLPTHFYVVVDDGSSDVLRPWIVNRDVALAGRGYLEAAIRAGRADEVLTPSFRPGDKVRVTGQRWSRFARSVDRLT